MLNNTPKLEGKDKLLSSFAELLEYPRSLSEVNSKLNLILDTGIEEMSAQLNQFRSFVEGISMMELEEAYTAQFDLNPSSHLYIGHHLYGETYKRSEFLIKLKEKFEEVDFEYNDNELPDFLPLLLQYLNYLKEEEKESFVQQLILPVLDKVVLGKPLTIKIPLNTELKDMGKDLEDFEPVKKGNPYMNLLHALRNYLNLIYYGGEN